WRRVTRAPSRRGNGSQFSRLRLRSLSTDRLRRPRLGGAMNFDIKTEQVDGAYVIALAGEVDLYTAPEFKQQLLDVIGKGGKEVIVDFTDTTFIDSTTLGVLVGGVKRLRTNDGQLSLVCSDRNITKIFEITGLDRVFAIYGTRDEAVSKLDGVSQPSS